MTGPRSKVVGLLIDAWVDLDRVLEGLTAEVALEPLDGGTAEGDMNVDRCIVSLGQGRYSAIQVIGHVYLCIPYAVCEADASSCGPVPLLA